MLIAATIKTVKHLALGREERMDLLTTRIGKAQSDFSGKADADGLFTRLGRVLDLENSWSDLFIRIEKEARLGENAPATALEGVLADLFRVDRALEEARAAFLHDLEDHPAWKGRMEPVASAVRRLQRISDRMRMVEEPERFPDQNDLAKIRQSKADLQELRKRADQLIDGLLEAREELDGLLAGVVENYAPERLNPVDRAILRLACYEAKHAGTPAKVAINEAIELAKRFGTSDSPRFVNGVLDRIMVVQG